MAATTRLLNNFTNGLLKPSESISIPKLSALSVKGEIKAFDLYAAHYTRLIETKAPSAFVEKLSKAVRTANNVLCFYVKMRHSDTIASRSEEQRTDIEDVAGAVNLGIFSAGSWLRRFVDGKSRYASWYEDQEKAEGNNVYLKLETDTKKLSDILLELFGSEFDYHCKVAKDIWDKDDAAIVEVYQKGSELAIKNLEKKLDVVKDNIAKLRFYVREAQDVCTVKNREEDKHRNDLIKEAEDLLRATNMMLVLPPWRKDSDTVLGPFGVKPIEKDGVGIRFFDTDVKTNFSKPPTVEELTRRKRNGTYTLYEDYASNWKHVADATTRKVSGALSPLFMITISPNDDTFTLIRIPKAAKYFAWAYPLATTAAVVENYTHGAIDLFLFVGGYVYFDKNLNFIRANALLPTGSQLQFSSPYFLSEQMHAELKEQSRFRPITLTFLKAKFFAWILPGEFSNHLIYGDSALPHNHPGAFAYCYDVDMNHTTRDNYFVLAAVQSVIGKDQ